MKLSKMFVMAAMLTMGLRLKDSEQGKNAVLAGSTSTETPTAETPTANPTAAPSDARKYHTCPPGSNNFIESADDGKYYWTDLHDAIHNLVSPDVIDNAGFYQSNGWNRRPEVLPDKGSLELVQYTAGATTPVDFILFDQYGNREFCTVNVTVLDNEDPKIDSCPTDKTWYTESDCKVAVTWTDATFTDNQDSATSPVGVAGPSGGNSGDRYTVGTFPINYRATDLNDNFVDCNFTMTVEDNTKPTFGTCGVDGDDTKIHQCGGLLGSEVGEQVSWACAATDNCHTESLDSVVDCDPWVEITSIQGVGFHTSNATKVNSTCGITAEADQLAKCETNWATDSDLVHCAIDNDCVESTDKVALFSGTAKHYFRGQSGDEFPIPPVVLDTDDTHRPTEYKVSCKVKDKYDNEESTSFTFEVADARKKPHFTYCPASFTITLPADDDVHTMQAGHTEPTYDNNAGCDVHIEESSGKNATTELPAGVHAFSYRIYDDSGNEAFCNFQVTVLDKNDLQWYNCPTDQKLETEEALLQYAIVSWTEPTVQKRGLNMTEDDVTITAPDAKSGMAFPLGITTLTYTVEDLRVHMNETTPQTCSFTIEIEDKEKPEFTGKSAIPSCGAEENGEPLGSFCNGKKIEITKRNSGQPEDFMYNADYDVVDVPITTCCGTNAACLPYSSEFPEFVHTCQTS